VSEAQGGVDKETYCTTAKIIIDNNTGDWPVIVEDICKDSKAWN